MRFLILIFIIFYPLYGSNICDTKLFSFDIPRTKSRIKVIDIVENLANECRFSVKIKDDGAKKILKSTISLVHIDDFTLNDMFEFLFTQNNLFYKYDVTKKQLNISYLQTRSFVIDYVNLSENATESVKTITVGAASTSANTNNNNGSSSDSSNSDSTTVTTKSVFQFWDKLSNEIDLLLSRDEDTTKISSKSTINREAGLITISGTRNQITRISNYLEKIKNRLHKQVMLETKLIELTYANSENTGINWSKFNLSLKGKIGKLWETGGDSNTFSLGYNFSMDGLLNFLKGYGKINVLSTPKILTLNNQPAVINVGKQINYRYQSGSLSTANATTSTSSTYIMSSVFIGLTLNIVPEITDDGFIILKINPVVSETFDSASSLDNGNSDVVDANGVRIMPPDIRIKQLSSIVKAEDNSKIVVGGLISSSVKNSNNKIPLLGDIPGLGWLFKSKSQSKYKTELIIIITPKIINDNNFPSIDRVEKLLDGSLDE